MDPRSIPEIGDAVAMLEHYERSGVRYEDAREFRSAMEELNDYVASDPETPHKQFINHIKEAYTKRMLERLGHVNRADESASLEHLVILVQAARDETRRLLTAHPELRADYERLLEAWKPKLVSALALAEFERNQRKRDRENGS